MSICLDTIIIQEKETPSKNIVKENRRTVLRCRDNISKPKCKKALKRKLKKYKLRKDGKEDQEIIDVSQTFITSLTIKSPNNQIIKLANLEFDKKESEDNQSFAMGRRKKDILNTDSAEIHNINSVSPTESSDAKKQTDAFKLLMDSRNKVIGCNSPGKERMLEPSEIQEIIEKKEIKAKRILSLQKMAQSKGALQKQEQEETREKYIKIKMEKRAEKFKNMITKQESNSKKNVHNKPIYKAEQEQITETPPPPKNEYILNKKRCFINQTEPTVLPTSSFPKNTFNQIISDEEVEFLKKLSPSIRKKENMLCYFNVVTKDTECVSDDSQNYSDNINNQAIIKVKFTPKSKKKNKTDNNTIDKMAMSMADNVASKNLEDKEIRQKRKRKKKSHESEPKNPIEDIKIDARPRRNTRKPAKYDNIILSSSDEELHIFTPKKKKSSKNNVEQTRDSKNEIVIDETSQEADKSTRQHLNKVSLKKTISSIQDKKPQKLAPIFTPKPQLTAEELTAKQKFLHSRIPNHVKKSVNEQVTNTYNFDTFPTVVHIQQISMNKNVKEDRGVTLLPLLHSDEELQITCAQPDLYKSFLMLSTIDNNVILDVKSNIETTLRSIKQLYSKFPVYRTYHSLKAKSRGEFGDSQFTYLDNSVEIINGIPDTCNDNPDKLKWTDKYKATSTTQIIGNFDSIKELRKWLISWTEHQVTVKRDSDSSDFCYSDTDSGDVIRMRNNLLILTGKSGSGKTSSVYAVASELSMKVIEVNASSKRTGKIMLQDLQEATQSHKVDRQRDCIENSQKIYRDRDTIILPKTKKRGRHTKNKENLPQRSISAKKDTNSEPSSSQVSSRTGMSLILIDDADIVFDQDDGFCSAIAQLVHSSKRPVILITESLHCPHLQKFLKYGQVINLQPFLPRMLGTWLDIMCIADNGICYPGLGSKLLDFYKGDIRKSINCLQFYITTQKYIMNQDSASQGCDFIDKDNDEGSSMSWAVNEDLEETVVKATSNSSIQYFMAKQLNMYTSLPCLSFNVWWSLPNLLDFDVDGIKKPAIKENKKPINIQLEAISYAIDTLSVLDMFEHNSPESQSNIASRPWFSPTSASLVENENFECYDRSFETKKEISQSLMTGSIGYAQEMLQREHKTDLIFPSMALQRERDKILSRHKSLTGLLNPSAALDRRAVSLDYWSSCRTICRMEKMKTDLSSKRNNRFCHYLKSLNVLCKNDYFDKLGDSLCMGGKV